MLRVINPKIGVLLFFGGLLLGVLVHYGLKFQSKDGSKIVRTAPVRVMSESEQERSLKRTLGFGRGLSSLLGALEDPPQSEHFRFLRSEFLQQIPNYSTSLLPALKEKALEQLILRFSEADWRAWPKSHLVENGRPSVARAYLDLVFAKNRELGLFLETGALLLHRLHLSTLKGEVFDLQQGFDYIVENADSLLVAYQPSSLPARYLLSYSVIRDLSFVPTFERERSRLVAEHVNSGGTTDLERNIRLLASIDGRYATPRAIVSLTDALLTVSVEGSARLRSEVVRDLLDSGALNSFFIGSEDVKRAAAQLAAVSAVDALEERDLIRSKRLLSLSLRLYPGLPSQQMVVSFFREYRLGFKQEEMVSAKLATEERNVGNTSVSYLGGVLLTLLSGGVLIGIIALWRSGGSKASARSAHHSVSPTLMKSPVREELAKEIDPGEDRKVVNLVRQ